MAMHRLPAGTEGPRWRVLAAVWAASAVFAVILALVLDLLTRQHIVPITAPLLWLAIQWAAWLYLKDRPARPRPFTYLEPEPDDSPTLRLAAVEEDSPDSGHRSGDLGLGDDLDRPGRHALREEIEVTEPRVPTGGRDPEEFWDHAMERMIDWFNPPDEDAACESICMDAVERAYKFAESQPCRCVGRGQDGDATLICQRCVVLGRVHDKAVQR